MNTPCRLAKEQVVENKYEAWLLSHAHIIVPVACVILCILVGLLIIVVLRQLGIIHMFSTEANLYYYLLEDL